MQPTFRTKVFLLRTLLGIFTAQAFLLAYAFYKCDSAHTCPEIGERTENLFNIAIATTLSLLGTTHDRK